MTTNTTSAQAGPPAYPPLPPSAKAATYANAHNTPAVAKGYEQGGYELTPSYYTSDQMRAYVDADRAQRASLEAQPSPSSGAPDPAWPLVKGVSRDANNLRAVVVYLVEYPTDDELRNIHEALRARLQGQRTSICASAPSASAQRPPPND